MASTLGKRAAYYKSVERGDCLVLGLLQLQVEKRYCCKAPETLPFEFSYIGLSAERPHGSQVCANRVSHPLAKSYAMNALLNLMTTGPCTA